MGWEDYGVEIGVNNEFWQRFVSLRKVMEGDFVRRFWVDGSEERLWKPS